MRLLIQNGSIVKVKMGVKIVNLIFRSTKNRACWGSDKVAKCFDMGWLIDSITTSCVLLPKFNSRVLPLYLKGVCGTGGIDRRLVVVDGLSIVMAIRGKAIVIVPK